MSGVSGKGKLEGRVCLVTGAARGMGAGFSRAFAAEGAKVVLTDMLEDQGRAVADEIGANALFLPHNVCEEKQWRRVVAEAESAFGPISGLVNNAGIFDGGMIEEFPVERFRRLTEINQTGVFLGMQAVIPSMRRAGRGSIINMSSTTGLVGNTGAVGYAASKWAVRGMTKVAALELAAYNIRVNSVHPGLIATPMTEAFSPAPGQLIPRAGKIQEVVHLLMYLMSDDSSYSTGAEFVIDGGQTAQILAPSASE